MTIPSTSAPTAPTTTDATKRTFDELNARLIGDPLPGHPVAKKRKTNDVKCVRFLMTLVPCIVTEDVIRAIDPLTRIDHAGKWIIRGIDPFIDIEGMMVNGSRARYGPATAATVEAEDSVSEE